MAARLLLVATLFLIGVWFWSLRLTSLQLAKEIAEVKAEAARLAPHPLPKGSSVENVGAELAKLERAFKAGDPIDLVEAVEWLGNEVFSAIYPENIRGWAVRLSEELTEAMTQDEYDRWAALNV